MKQKCPICGKDKGRRLCKIKEGSRICSRCCAAARNPNCHACGHYVQTEKYTLEKMKKSRFQKFIARIDPEVDEAVDHALTHVEKGDLTTAEEILTELMEKHPDLHIVHYGMGTLLAMQGNYADSITCFERCLEIFPYFAEAWFNKGTSHKHLLDVGNTIKSFQKVVELGDREDSFVGTADEFLVDMASEIFTDTGLSIDLYLQSKDIFDQAFLCMRNQEYEEAITGFRNVLNLEKNHTQSYGNLGLCYSFLGKKQEALAALDRALEIDPNYVPALGNREIVRSLQEGEQLPIDHIKVVDYYKEVIERRGQDNT